MMLIYQSQSRPTTNTLTFPLLSVGRKLCLDNIIPLCLLNILYCSPFSHQSLEPCSISVYSCFGLDLNNPINAKTAYIIVKYKSVFPKYPIYAASNTLVIDVKLTISVNTFSKNISKSKLPPWFARPIAYPIGATSTMDKITHSTTIIIKLFYCLLRFY